MNERMFQQKLNNELSEISLAQAQKTRILGNLNRRSVRRLPRLSVAAVVIICISLLAVGALAWIMVPTIADWLAQRDDPRISSAFLQNSPIASPLIEQQLGDVTVTVWEAMADEKTFVTNTQFQYEGDGDVKLVAFSGLMDEITPEEAILYVSAASYYGDANNEIYSAVQTDGHTLTVLAEGRQKNNLDDTLFIEITLVSTAEPEPARTTVTVPVKHLSTLEEYNLSEPVYCSETGFVLKALSVIRTELRVYFSYEISGAQRPLASAVRFLEASIVDQNGMQLPSALSYGEPVPKVLVLQVFDEENEEIVEQVQLRLEEDRYIPVQTTEEEIL